MIKVGRTYSFKTTTLYYVGTVVAVWPTHAEIRDAVEVYETGSNAEFFGGKAKTGEPIPDGTLVPLTGGTIVMPFERVRVSG